MKLIPAKCQTHDSQQVSKIHPGEQGACQTQGSDGNPVGHPEDSMEISDFERREYRGDDFDEIFGMHHER